MIFYMTGVEDEPFDISDEQIRAIVDGYVQQLPDTLDFFGVKQKKMRTTKSAREEFYGDTKNLISKFRQLSKFKEPRYPNEALQMIDTFSEVMKTIVKVPKGMHLFDYFRRYFSAIINVPASLGYLKKTNYRKYRDALNEIVLHLYQLNRVQPVEKLLDEFGKSSEGSVLAQSTLMRLTKQMNYLKILLLCVENAETWRFAYYCNSNP